MRKVWKKSRLGDIAHVSWGDTSKTKASYSQDGYPAYSATGPDGFMPHYDHEGDGVVLSAIGANCGMTWLARGRWSCIKNTMYFQSTSPDADTLFLYYATKDPVIWPKRGAAQPFISQTDARNVEIALPPPHVQRKIVAVLSAYDDLIGKKARRARILEKMAEAIYREWFVEFRFPGYERVRMVDSELGPIPESWKVVSVPQAIEINPRTKASNGVLKPYVAMDGLSNDSMLIIVTEQREGTSGSKFRNGDTLFARITPCLENGKTGYVQFLPAKEDVAIGSTEFIVLRSNTLCPEYVYLLSRIEEFRNNAIKSMTGASGRQRVQPACFDKFRFAHPDPKAIGKFQQIVAPLFRDVQVLAEANENLRRTRDLLLPRLVLGEVDISELSIVDGGLVDA